MGVSRVVEPKGLFEHPREQQAEQSLGGELEEKCGLGVIFMLISFAKNLGDADG